MSLSRYRNPFDSSPLVTETIGHGTIGLANIYLKTRIFSFLHGASFTPRTRLLWPQRVTFNRSFFSPPFRVLENKSILPKWIWKWNQYISLYRERYKLSFYIVHIYLLTISSTAKCLAYLLTKRMATQHVENRGGGNREE